jgi:hypothetical protein
LMPGHEPGAVGFLDEEVGRPAEKVGPEHVFGRIEDFGMMHKRVYPCEQQMSLMAKISLERFSSLGLMPFETLAGVRNFIRRKHGHWKVVSVLTIGLQRGIRETPEHRLVSCAG